MSTLCLTDALRALAGELCGGTTLLTRALTERCSSCISDISECHRRCTSLAADTHAYLFSVFQPPLPRAHCTLLCEKLCAAVGAALDAGLCLPPDWTPTVRLLTEMQGLGRMCELLHQGVTALPRLVKGRDVALPDTFRFYAEHTKARAAHALYVAHSEQRVTDVALSESLARLRVAIAHAYSALLALVSESL